MELREYQQKIVNRGIDILRCHGLLALFMEVRTGKTLTSLSIAEKFGAKKVLCITRKEAINSITNDFHLGAFSFNFVCINKEQIKNLETCDFDLVIVDEVHGFATFPHRGIFHKIISKKFGHLPLILLSGTPTTESYSQFFHIFALSQKHKYSKTNFYNWAKNGYVDIYEMNISYNLRVRKYDRANVAKIREDIKDYIIDFTQEEAGFNIEKLDVILDVEMNSATKKYYFDVVKNKVLGSEIIDTPAKMMCKVHQLSGGTVIMNGKVEIVDTQKCKLLQEKFNVNSTKIAIFYKFVGELEILQKFFGDKITTDINDFNTLNYKWIALQYRRGSEGTNLSKADCIIFYNMDYSNLSFIQARDRATTLKRREINLYYLCSDLGIEKDILKVLKTKNKYTHKIWQEKYEREYYTA